MNNEQNESDFKFEFAVDDVAYYIERTIFWDFNNNEHSYKFVIKCNDENVKESDHITMSCENYESMPAPYLDRIFKDQIEALFKDKEIVYKQ